MQIWDRRKDWTFHHSRPNNSSLYGMTRWTTMTFYFSQSQRYSSVAERSKMLYCLLKLRQRVRIPRTLSLFSLFVFKLFSLYFSCSNIRFGTPPCTTGKLSIISCGNSNWSTDWLSTAEWSDINIHNLKRKTLTEQFVKLRTTIISPSV